MAASMERQKCANAGKVISGVCDSISCSISASTYFGAIMLVCWCQSVNITMYAYRLRVDVCICLCV